MGRGATVPQQGAVNRFVVFRLAETALHFLWTGSGDMTNTITVETDLVDTIARDMVSSTASTAGFRLGIVKKGS